jgi:hypothetical protein
MAITRIGLGSVGVKQALEGAIGIYEAFPSIRFSTAARSCRMRCWQKRFDSAAFEVVRMASSHSQLP